MTIVVVPLPSVCVCVCVCVCRGLGQQTVTCVTTHHQVLFVNIIIYMSLLILSLVLSFIPNAVMSKLQHLSAPFFM